MHPVRNTFTNRKHLWLTNGFIYPVDTFKKMIAKLHFNALLLSQSLVNSLLITC